MEGLQDRLVAPEPPAVPANAGECRPHLALKQWHTLSRIYRYMRRLWTTTALAITCI